MEHKLSRLFDRQKFQQNARLSSIIDAVESRYARAMNDDDLALVSAAGDTDATQPMAKRITEKEVSLVYERKEEQP